MRGTRVPGRRCPILRAMGLWEGSQRRQALSWAVKTGYELDGVKES